jgi:hypothetical protein
MQPDNLIHVKDDMIAFIEGHGMRRFPGYVLDEIPSVVWEDEDNPESWKDFVESAKHAGAVFLTMSDIVLEKDDVEMLLEHLTDQNFPDDEAPELEEAHMLENYIGKTGYIQLGYAYQGVFFLHETATPWYERYQQLLEQVEEFGDIILEDGDDEDSNQ